MSITDYLVSPRGTNKKRKRRGRGMASGHGKTSCRGHKGQKARGKTKRTKGFEGGQMPLIRRLPKRGFINRFRSQQQLVNLNNLNIFPSGSVVTPILLKEKGMIKKSDSSVKVLGDGKLGHKLEIQAHAFSDRAKEAIEKLGGKAMVIRDK